MPDRGWASKGMTRRVPALGVLCWGAARYISGVCSIQRSLSEGPCGCCRPSAPWWGLLATPPLWSPPGLSSVLARGQSARWARICVERPPVLLQGAGSSWWPWYFPHRSTRSSWAHPSTCSWALMAPYCPNPSSLWSSCERSWRGKALIIADCLLQSTTLDPLCAKFCSACQVNAPWLPFFCCETFPEPRAMCEIHWALSRLIHLLRWALPTSNCSWHGTDVIESAQEIMHLCEHCLSSPKFSSISLSFRGTWA